MFNTKKILLMFLKEYFYLSVTKKKELKPFLSNINWIKLYNIIIPHPNELESKIESIIMKKFNTYLPLEKK